MTEEPPKPITKLATPIDRSGPRGKNRMGDRAWAMGMTSWISGILAYALGRSPGGSLALVVAILALVAMSMTTAAFAVVRGILGLMRAAERHLKREHAIGGIIAGVPPLAFWLGWVLPFLLGLRF